MAKSYKTITLEGNTYRQYLFAKHHIRPGSQADSFEEVINSVVGVHSARLPSPYVAFQARMKNIKPTDYRSATYGSNDLIKLRCMRKTLHTVTQELAPIVHIATLRLRTTEIQSHLKRHGFPLELAESIMREAVEVALKFPRSHREIISWIAERVDHAKPQLPKKRSIDIARLLLKWSWETGQICYLNHAEHWAHEVRFYASTDRVYPKLRLSAFTCEQAVLELVARYIRAFEPVSEKDIAWWSGIRISEVRKALADLAPNLLRLGLEGVADQLLMTKQGFEEYSRFQHDQGAGPWCAFLAYEDPTLKGYFNTRARYVSQTDYDRLFNQIGEVLAERKS